jgi:ComEC/Rec2-related protein
MKRPLLGVALLYGMGIILADLSPVSLPAFATLWIAATVALLAIAWTRARPVLLLVLLPLAGAANLVSRTAVIAPHDLRNLLGETTAIGKVRGRLVETPYSRSYERREHESWRTLGQLDVAVIQLQGQNWQPAMGRVMISGAGIVSRDFFAGRPVELEGILRLPQSPVADGLFDYTRYLLRQGIYYQLLVSSTNDWRLAEGASAVRHPVADRFGDWAMAMLARGLPTEDEPLQLLRTMTLGWKTGLTGEMAEPFMRSGTMHIFAISGLHVALISGILVAALRVFRVPRVACGLIVVPFLWIYTGFTGWQASAIRSTIMMSVIIAGWSIRRPSDLLNSLAAAAFIILLLDPSQLFQAGFQLSFSVVLSLALFIPVLDVLRRKLLRYDPLIPEELRPRWQRWARPPLDYVSSGLTTSLAAWLGSIPLIAYYFHLFTPVSLLANLLVVPLSSLALACTTGSLFVGAWIPLAAELFNNSAWFLMWLMVRISEWCAQLPGGWCCAAPPSLLGFLLYYAILVSLMAGWLTRARWRGWVLGALGAMASLWMFQFVRHAQTTRLTVLPLKGGEAVYFTPAWRGEKLLIDCGDTSAFEFIVKPFLRGQGLNRLDGLLLTHGDIHNVGGAVAAAATFPVQKIFLNGASFRSTAYRRVRAHFESMRAPIQTLHRGDRIGIWEVLHPDATDAFRQADDDALVLRADVEGFRLLLMSDLGKAGQNVLVQRYPDLRADVVVAGLPRQGEPLAEVILDLLDARLIVITDSEYPATARASRRLQERLAARQVPVLYTRETGAVTLEFRGGRAEVRAMNGFQLKLKSGGRGNPDLDRKFTPRQPNAPDRAAGLAADLRRPAAE